MASSTHCQWQTMALTKVKSSCNIVRVSATHDQCRMPVVGEIVNFTGKFIVGRIGQDYMTADLRS